MVALMRTTTVNKDKDHDNPRLRRRREIRRARHSALAQRGAIVRGLISNPAQAEQVRNNGATEIAVGDLADARSALSRLAGSNGFGHARYPDSMAILARRSAGDPVSSQELFLRNRFCRCGRFGYCPLTEWREDLHWCPPVRRSVPPRFASVGGFLTIAAA